MIKCNYMLNYDQEIPNLTNIYIYSPGNFYQDFCSDRKKQNINHKKNGYFIAREMNKLV